MSEILEIRKWKMRKRKKRVNTAYRGKIEIRDAREKAFFIIDDEYFNGFSRICGVQATLVYMALCRHAGKDQTCFPSVDLMSERLGVSRRSIIRGLKSLEDHRVIKVDRVRGESNIYTLTNKRVWRKFTPIVSESDLSQALKGGHFLGPCSECLNNGDSDVCLGCQSGTHFVPAHKGFVNGD